MENNIDRTFTHFSSTSKYGYTRPRIINITGELLFKAIDRSDQRELERLLALDNVDITARNRDDDTPLHVASAQGNAEAVRAIVAVTRPNVIDAADANGCTPLMRAAAAGHVAVIVELAKAGGNLEAKAAYWPGGTAFLIAVRHGNLDVIRTLHELGADMDVVDRYGYSAVMIAAERGQMDVIRALQDLGENIDSIIAHHNSTALWVSLQKGYMQMASTLLKAGANYKGTDDQGSTALDWAVEHGHKEMVDMFIRTADLEARGWRGQTVLMRARRAEIAEALIDAKANITAQDDWGDTPLICAAKEGDVAVVEVLLNHVAEPQSYINLRNGNGLTALHFAARLGKADVVSALVGRGADVEVRTSYATVSEIAKSSVYPFHAGLTALMLAGRDVDTMRALLEAKADVNAVDDQGFTPLMHAAQGGYTTAVSILHDGGAALELKNCDRMTALMLAAKHGRHDTVVQLHRLGASSEARDLEGYTALMLAAANGNVDMIRTLHKVGADINARSDDGATPLMIAIRHYHTEVCKTLLDLGADVHARDLDGGTALLAAAELCMTEEVAYLIVAGADVNMPNIYGITPLMAAANNNAADTIELLLLVHPRISATSNTGETALAYAIQAEASEAQGVLLQYRPPAQEG
jgi:ankyrin repeat protein